MTGYARADGKADSFAWTWEVKSVNGRGLDVRCRFPPGMDTFEREVRGALAESISRGNVSVTLNLSRPEGSVRPSVNREFLESLLELAKSRAAGTGGDPPRIETLLSVRGVVEVVEPEETEAQRQTREAAMRSSLRKVVADLVAARQEEGKHLEAVVRDQLNQISELVSAAEGLVSLQPETLRARLVKQLRDLTDEAPVVADDRVAQEVALLLVKYDIREELDRIRAHLLQAGEMVDSSKAVGRRFDFLAQELNREANTVCSKSSDSELSRIGLDLKTVIDRLREQVQNIE